MSLQKYTALLKTVDTGSISRAAEEMGYTQSAVSRMIADLEAQWGLDLLRRSRGGVTLTSAGKRILPILRSITADCSELEYIIGELHGLRNGLIRIGTFTSMADMWLPGLLKTFHQSFPNIEFELMNSENYAEIESWICHGQVDCGFVSMPAAHDLDVVFLKRDTLVAVLPPDHPLAAEPVFPVKRLAEEPIIKLKEDVDYEIARFMDRIAIRPKVRYEVSGDHTILSMVEQGLGISVMHSLIAGCGRYDVVWKEFDVQQYRDIGIATVKNLRVPSLVRLFVERAAGRGC